MKLKFKLQKTDFKLYYLFYIGFFVLYLAGQYYFLYHVNGLNPFSANIHFFSNVIGSLSKRFLSEVSMYGLIFYLLYFTKNKIVRASLIILFSGAFLINVFAITFYYFARTNFQFYILEGFSFSILFSYFTPAITAVSILLTLSMGFMAYALWNMRNKEEVWLFKKRVSIFLLALLTCFAPLLPIRYNDNITLFSSDPIQKKTFRIFSLDKSGIVLLTEELKFKYSRSERLPYTLTEDEKKSLDRKNLDTQITQDNAKPPKKIILVVAESLNQRFLSFYNKKIPGLTPNIDNLLSEYPHIFEFYPSGPYTLYGLGAMLCGHTNIDIAKEKQSHLCVPKLLSDAGYNTSFIRGATKYYVGENMSFGKFGYDSVFAKEDFEKKNPEFMDERSDLFKTWGYSDKSVFDEAIERLKNSKPEDKLFLTLLTVDTHTPGGRCSYKKTPDDPKDPLEHSIKCFDRVFGEFIDNLKKQGLLDEDTIVILTADQLYPTYNKLPGDDFQTSFILKPAYIPFLLISGGKYELKAKQGSHIDIAGTLLDLVGLKIPSYYMGKSLLSNPYTIPMGQDRMNGYMIVDGEFTPMDLFSGIKPKNDTGPKSLKVEVPVNASEKDIDIIMQQKVDEYNQQKNQDSGLFKWYYNKYFELSDNTLK